MGQESLFMQLDGLRSFAQSHSDAVSGMSGLVNAGAQAAGVESTHGSIASAVHSALSSTLGARGGAMQTVVDAGNKMSESLGKAAHAYEQVDQRFADKARALAKAIGDPGNQNTPGAGAPATARSPASRPGAAASGGGGGGAAGTPGGATGAGAGAPANAGSGAASGAGGGASAGARGGAGGQMIGQLGQVVGQMTQGLGGMLGGKGLQQMTQPLMQGVQQAAQQIGQLSHHGGGGGAGMPPDSAGQGQLVSDTHEQGAAGPDPGAGADRAPIEHGTLARDTTSPAATQPPV